MALYNLINSVYKNPSQGPFQLLHCIHTMTCTFVEIECAVQPDKRMHSKMILKPIGVILLNELYDPQGHWCHH